MGHGFDWSRISGQKVALAKIKCNPDDSARS